MVKVTFRHQVQLKVCNNQRWHFDRESKQKDAFIHPMELPPHEGFEFVKIEEFWPTSTTLHGAWVSKHFDT